MGYLKNSVIIFIIWKTVCDSSNTYKLQVDNVGEGDGGNKEVNGEGFS